MQSTVNFQTTAVVVVAVADIAAAIPTCTVIFIVTATAVNIVTTVVVVIANTLRANIDGIGRWQISIAVTCE